MRIQIYISVLILIHKSASEAVSRPANVSIHCDSYGVEARWEYPDPSQDVLFNVEVNQAVKHDRTRTQRTQKKSLNISSMLFYSDYNYYTVTVKAVREGEESVLGTSDVFGFNEEATNAKIKCRLDFPEVELSPKDGKLHVQFINPLDLYRETPALRNCSNTCNLQYTVETEEGQKNTTTCEKETKTCEASIGFSNHSKLYCVSLTGRIGQRELNPRRSCFTGDIRIYPSFTVYLYLVLGVGLTLLALICIILLVVKKCNSKIKKKASSMLPGFLVIGPTQTHQCKPLKLEPEMYCDLKIEPYEEPTEQTTFPEKQPYSDEEPGSSDEDEGRGDSDICPYGANDFDEAGYDCPHTVLTLEMSPGDMVKGYGR